MITDQSKNIKMQETLQMIEGLRLMDDNLMSLVFDRNIEATELLLHTILDVTMRGICFILC